jgi:hypothetical protein
MPEAFSGMDDYADRRSLPKMQRNAFVTLYRRLLQTRQAPGAWHIGWQRRCWTRLPAWLELAQMPSVFDANKARSSCVWPWPPVAYFCLTRNTLAVSL